MIRWNGNLSIEEKNLITDPSDYPLISEIKGIPEDALKKIDKSIKIKKEYQKFHNDLQNLWVGVFKWFYCQNRDINCEEKLYSKESTFASDFLFSGLPQKFHLYFAIRHSDKIDVVDKNEYTISFFNDFNLELFLKDDHYEVKKNNLSLQNSFNSSNTC